MPVRAVRAGADFVEIDDGGRVFRLSESDLPSVTRAGGKAKMADAFKALAQAFLTVRQKVRDLPDDDPDKTRDPAMGERLFWEGRGANRELVGRSVIVEAVVWDGERYVPTLRKAR